ncbi:hypothetical protein [Dyadobacter arcticus]|uniref:Uncharacterized protein n=1 Tax=Dyadobacter arcticus TaxID=1078754 RepID=A0ABX0UEW6_9BACT|nr:hypothetical protein [Dyadobacter arcticus]NIJ51548.1 hypothetical protein [Dyadobacter arcticus]
MKNSLNPDDFWFPGRWVGGISLIVGPLLLLVGSVLRLPFDFFFTNQLIAFKQHPMRIMTAYNLFLAGNILLYPAIITLATLIGRTKPGWAIWGGNFVLLGLFARTFHYGINHLAFQLVEVQSLGQATEAVANSYGAFHIVATLSAAILSGWTILAIGAYLSKAIGLIRAIALASMSALMIGVLKGSSIVSVLVILGLCVAMVPLGVEVLRSGPKPGRLAILKWSVLMFLLIGVMYFLGQAG